DADLATGRRAFGIALEWSQRWRRQGADGFAAVGAGGEFAHDDVAVALERHEGIGEIAAVAGEDFAVDGAPGVEILMREGALGGVVGSFSRFMCSRAEGDCAAGDGGSD